MMNKNLSRNLLIVSALVASLFGGLSFYFASQDYKADSVIFNTSKDIALNGYDTVSYFTDKVAARGTPDYQADWAGSTWYFTNSKNRDLFVAKPANYVPQYGGYDPVGVSKGYTNPTDPEVYTVVAGRLYLHYSEPFREFWDEDRGTNIVLANSNWAFLRDKLLKMQEAE
jgi:YHS domain-containing protein